MDGKRESKDSKLSAGLDDRILVGNGKIGNLNNERLFRIYIYISVKYSLADNMGQGKNPMAPSQSDALEESDLWTVWRLFPLDDDQICHSKDGGSAYSDGQLWEEITGACRHAHISAWEFDGVTWGRK